MSPSPIDMLMYGTASLLMCILSGISGGGGGFVMTPLLIFLGLSPAQAVATGKLAGLSVTLGSLHGLRDVRPRFDRRFLLILVLAAAIGLAAPFFIKTLEHELYKTILGGVILLMVPVLLWKKAGLHDIQPSGLTQAVGYMALGAALFLQAVFSGGLGVLVSVVMMSLLGMPALEANVTKRYSQLVLNILVILGVVFSGLIVWQMAVIGIVTSFIGGVIGGRIAVRRGNGFVTAVMLLLMSISGVWLIVS